MAPGLHRVATPGVNWYVVEDGGRLTVVDAGLPAHSHHLEEALHSIAHDLGHVGALVLTHAHADHVGFAERLRREVGVTVHVHERDESLARTAKAPKPDRLPLRHLWRPSALGFLGHMVRGGALRPPKIEHVSTFADGDVLEVPGRPRVIHTPGHTDGSCALLFPDHGVLVAGDALCSPNPVSGRPGPQIGPINVDTDQALESLGRIERVDAGCVVFGHGEPWTGGVAAAVAEARRAGRT